MPGSGGGLRDVACEICGFHTIPTAGMPGSPRKTESVYNKVLRRGPIDDEIILKLKCHV